MPASICLVCRIGRRIRCCTATHSAVCPVWLKHSYTTLPLFLSHPLVFCLETSNIDNGKRHSSRLPISLFDRSSLAPVDAPEMLGPYRDRGLHLSQQRPRTSLLKRYADY